jgi:hypothetical protein
MGGHLDGRAAVPLAKADSSPLRTETDMEDVPIVALLAFEGGMVRVSR